MKSESLRVNFERLASEDKLPYDLLLLADPSVELLDEYLKKSEIYQAILADEVVGVMVLFPLANQTLEIKNIAVKPVYQGQGIGTHMIQHAIQIAISKRQHHICIGTANSSIAQLYMYQKLGFEISELKMDFFIRYYQEPIYENGIQAKHMLVMTKRLPLPEKQC